jgi:hypothetical protein
VILQVHIEDLPHTPQVKSPINHPQVKSPVNIHRDWGRIGDVPQATLLRGDIGLDHILLNTRPSNVDVQKPVITV